MSAKLLDVDELSVAFRGLRGTTEVLSRASFAVEPGEIVGVVGESGSGKSAMALAIMRLLGAAGAITGGHIRFEGRDLASLGEAELNSMRGRRIGMIFQEPMTSLNPILTVGYQLREVLARHLGLTGAAARKRAIELLSEVGIAAPVERAGAYPHQLSGGLRQRVMIAMAMACRPKLLIADEPTTALDVTIQAQILALLRDLQRRLGMGVVLITHDLGVVAETCDRVVVMYAGRKVEEASTVDLFERPLHPYTQALMASMPSLNATAQRLAEIPGLVPAPQDLGRGCAFAPRCPLAGPRCRVEQPLLETHGADHTVACFAVAATTADGGDPLATPRPA